MKLTPRQTRQLIAAAKAARRSAYAPYSKFRVGAAILTTTGEIFTGVNVENASYGLTICAERVAIGAAVSNGHRRFRAIAIVAPGKNVTPCGACRQVLAEFGECVVILAEARNSRRFETYRLSELLPESFKLC